MGPEEQIEALLDEAEVMIAGARYEQALALCAQALIVDPEHPGALFVQGDCLRATGQIPEALVAYRAAALARPDHADSWASLALTAYELLDLREADRALHRALRQDPRSAQAWWVRAMLREWRGDLDGADRSLLHAAWLDPDSYPLPPTLTDDEIEELVEDTLLSLPDSIRSYLSNTTIHLEELPSIEVLRQYDPPASPMELLGYFTGPTLMDRGEGHTPWSNLPANIVLFRRNLQRFAIDRETLLQELHITLLHEVGHFLGLDEDDLERRGLD
jgi:predicted Zn-dependent protease with MMP-like domain